MKDNILTHLSKRTIKMIIISTLILLVIIIGFLLCPHVTNAIVIQKARNAYKEYEYRGAYTFLKSNMETNQGNENMAHLLLKIVNTVSSFTHSDYEYTHDLNFLNILKKKFENSKNGRLLAEIGYSYWINNEKRKAFRYYQKALERAPNYYPLHNYLGNYYYYYSDFTRAFVYYEQLFQSNPVSLTFIGLNTMDNFIYKEILKIKNLRELYLSCSNTFLLENLGELKDLEVFCLIEQKLPNNKIHFLPQLKNLQILSLHSNLLTHMRNLNTLSNLKRLYCSNNRIRKIDTFTGLTHLTLLDLQSNIIATIENLDSLTHLEELYLCHNKLSTIENLGALNNLTTLDLSDNQIRTLENFDNLFNLKILNVNNNRLTRINSLQSLNSLEAFYARGNQIGTIENLENLGQLKLLDLRDDKIAEIKNIHQLTNLESLNLSNNKIKTLENLESLVKLKTLDLGKNNIREIQNLGQLSHLEILLLSFNKIKKIENLTNLTLLRKLEINYNDIDVIENLDPLSHLRELNLGGNKIQKIENLDTLTRLTILHLSDNKIVKIDGLSNLVNLETLMLGTNTITKIENMDNLKNLRTLNLNSNHIKILENLSGLTHLEHLFLKYNDIGTSNETVIIFPPSFNTLKTIKITGPRYSNPGSIEMIRGNEHLTSIEEFEFSFQNLKELPDLSSLSTLHTLHIEKHANLKPIDYTRIPRGLKSLTMWNVNLTNLDGIENLNNLEILWIGDNRHLTSLSRLKNLASLRELNVGLCYNLPAEEIINLSKITLLHVVAVQYPEEIFEILQKKGIRVVLF